MLDLAGDTGQPGVVRATALWLVEQRADRPAADRAATMLDDPDPLVRAAAIGVQKAAGQQDRVQRVLPRLNDPAKMVRIQAAKALLGVPIAHMPERMAASMRRAMSEWQRSLVARADFSRNPHGDRRHRADDAQYPGGAGGAFREAVRMDPQREEAWVMLARITAATKGARPPGPFWTKPLPPTPGATC
ncbi:HEAT repeat domain-containing protein [Jhaorihella thermophila]